MKIFLRLQEFSNQKDEQHIKLHLKPILSLIVSYEKEPENLHIFAEDNEWTTKKSIWNYHTY